MWKANVGFDKVPKPPVDDDDWETDPDFINNVTEEEQRWGSKTIEGSGRTAGTVDMNKLIEETTKADLVAKEKLKAELPGASYGYGGKFGVEKDRMDSSAVGNEYHAPLGKHVSQTDYSAGFGGKFGVQRDRVDKSAVGWSHKEKVEKHGSQTDYSSGFGGKFGVEKDRQDKSAVGWDHIEKPQKHDSQTVTKGNVIEQSQKPSQLRQKFESFSQKKEDLPRPLAKPKSVSQKWPPVQSTPTNTATSYASDHPVKASVPRETVTSDLPVKTSAPRATNYVSDLPVKASVPRETFASHLPAVKTATPRANVTSESHSSSEVSKSIESPKVVSITREESVTPKKQEEPARVFAPSAVVLPPHAFQNQPSEEEWDTGRDDDDEPEVHQIKEEKKPKNEPVVVRNDPVVAVAQIIDDEEAEREESALRQQLAQEINDETNEDESPYSAIALYDYQAAADDEISFDPDEIITNIDMIDEGWWRGTCRGVTGLFPANYVQLHG